MWLNFCLIKESLSCQVPMRVVNQEANGGRSSHPRNVHAWLDPNKMGNLTGCFYKFPFNSEIPRFIKEL